MRPNKPKATGEGDLFRAHLDQIINMKHELVQLAARIDWDSIDRERATLYSDNGRPGIETRFVIGLLLLKHIYGLSTKACVSAGSMTLTSSTSSARSFSIPARALRPQPLEEAARQQARVASRRELARGACGRRTAAPATSNGSRWTPRSNARCNCASRICASPNAPRCWRGRYAHAKQFRRHHRQLRLLRTRLTRHVFSRKAPAWVRQRTRAAVAG